jgi:hypothetical protein
MELYLKSLKRFLSLVNILWNGYGISLWVVFK